MESGLSSVASLASMLRGLQGPLARRTGKGGMVQPPCLSDSFRGFLRGSGERPALLRSPASRSGGLRRFAPPPSLGRSSPMLAIKAPRACRFGLAGKPLCSATPAFRPLLYRSRPLLCPCFSVYSWRVEASQKASQKAPRKRRETGRFRD